MLNTTLVNLVIHSTFTSPIFSPSFSESKNNWISFKSIKISKSSLPFFYCISNFKISVKSSCFSRFTSNAVVFDREDVIQNNITYNIFQTQNFNQTVKLESNISIPVIFDDCVFVNIHSYSSGGAIYDRRYLDIHVITCSFINCTTNDQAGAIYVDGSPTSQYVKGNIQINECTFTNCFNSVESSSYKAGVILIYIGRGSDDEFRTFEVSQCGFINCQYPQESRICEGQIKCFANKYNINNANCTNKNKIDYSCIIHAKYSQSPSYAKFLKGINQNGITTFEIFNIEGSTAAYEYIDLINTTQCFSTQYQGSISVFRVYNVKALLYINNVNIVDITINGSDTVTPNLLIDSDQIAPVFSNCYTNSNSPTMITKGYCEYIPEMYAINDNVYGVPLKEITSENDIHHTLEISEDEIVDSILTSSKINEPHFTSNLQNSNSVENEILTISNEIVTSALYLSSSSSSIDSSKQNNDSESDKENKNKLSSAAIAGIAIAITVVVVIICIIIIVVIMMKKANHITDTTESDNLEDEYFNNDNKKENQEKDGGSLILSSETAFTSTRTDSQQANEDIEEFRKDENDII
ncbi:hypothetical protein TRFO_14896 [Tritrichomonas foetus]|uniref:Uncharacterized protein n=1 Tax=Tritrichomonas foetus TaxID=1144522 RepID=A0A1J4KTU3_9EUKA|nr:hypothetical protein TRFO_14896 [Tritrichomonas foetus]|eukprot:OHT14705.1 hypothetical protein TRFO_14896 [Tritrichomonas foetus]